MQQVISLSLLKPIFEWMSVNRDCCVNVGAWGTTFGKHRLGEDPNKNSACSWRHLRNNITRYVTNAHPIMHNSLVGVNQMGLKGKSLSETRGTGLSSFQLGRHLWIPLFD